MVKIDSVQKLIILILIGLHILCLYGTSGGRSFVITTKYEIVHTHHDDDHDYVEDFNDHESHSKGDHENRPHKHEVAVNAQIQYVQSGGIVLIVKSSDPLKYGLVKADMPLAPHLKGIFRPPILS